MNLIIDCIFLIGYMGCGKTTVGKELSDLTGFYLVDMDKEIEKAEQSSIRNIFIKYGEHEFRNKEAELLDKLCNVSSIADIIVSEENINTKVLIKESKYQRFANIKDNGLIVSCGGGIILDDINRMILKKQCTIFLEGNPIKLFERVNGDANRPFAFMDVEDEKERLQRFLELYNKRKDLYKATSSHIINIDDKTPKEIAIEILYKLNNTGV